LIPTDHSTFKIIVPWFPGGCWVVDIPESGWGGLSGANDWPYKAPESWKVDWKTNADGSRIEYFNKKGDKSVKVVVTAEGDSVECGIHPVNLGRINLASICVKALNPFFCSQEVMCQHYVRGKQLVPVSSLPRQGDSALQFAWRGNKPPSHGASLMRSLDGNGYFAVIGPQGCGGGGNGCYPCTHLNGQYSDGDANIKLIFQVCGEKEIIERLN
jgi:hypothetical protein